MSDWRYCDACEGYGWTPHRVFGRYGCEECSGYGFVAVPAPVRLQEPSKREEGRDVAVEGDKPSTGR